MSVAILTERIRQSISAGELKPVPEASTFRPVNSLTDLLSDWEELFPGIETNEEGDTVSLFGWNALRRPVFTAQPRRSCRPLSPPRPVTPMPQPPCKPGLFLSIQAIWAYYEETGLADTALIDRPFNSKDLLAFIAPLEHHTSDYWPLSVPLENLEHDGDIEELTGIRLMLPHHSYDDETAGTVEAFLSGPETLASHLDYQHRQANFMELPEKDEQLIKEVGFDKLAENFALFSGEKSCDLFALENWFETFFAEVDRQFPDNKAGNYSIISGNGGDDNEICIRRKEDISFSLAYSDSYCIMMSTFPDPNDFEYNEGGITETFVHELCDAWRTTHGKRPLKWTSPKRDTLAQMMKRGEF